MEQNGDQPPLEWPQFESTGYRRRRSPVSAFFSPPAIILTYTVAFLLISIFIVPPFLSITSQILRPVSVKKSWDSINLFLVLFAILCGVFARRNDDGLTPSPSHSGDERAVNGGSMNAGEDSKISSPVSQQWFSDVYAADRLKIYESVRSSAPSPVTGTVRLRRSSSSYPDLRQGFFGDTGDRHLRFYDDFEINKYRSPEIATWDGYERIQNRRKFQIEELETKEIPVDKFEVRPPSPPREPPAPPPPPPPQPPSAEVAQKPRRMQRSVSSETTPENARHSDTDSNSTKFKHAPPPAPPPPPPPPPPPTAPFTPPRTGLRYEAERKEGRLERRKSNAAKEIKLVLASLYNQRKRKRKLQKAKTKHRNESPETEPSHYQSTIPPPPPPPTPPRSSQSVFYGLFKKGSKSKKVHSVPAPPPPPPPPPSSSRTSKRKTRLGRPPPPAPPTPPRRTSGKPPRPTKPTNFYEENYVNSGRESPLIPIPPPPPPPFRVPPMKFVVRGDFAKIQSNQSSRCSSPEREVIDLGWGLELTQSDGSNQSSPNENTGTDGGRSFCPSPDVNTKADSFIARLRGEWRLEKINSVKEKRKLGSGPNRNPV